MTSRNSLFIRITAELMLGATYRVNIESGTVVPLLSCPQQPGQTGLVLSSDFEWTFTAGVCDVALLHAMCVVSSNCHC